jgi:high-affinity iron transporter
MLINTVILFLRDALPILVLVVYLSVLIQASKFWLISCLVTGAILSLIYINQIHTIGQWCDGIGIELSMWLSQFLVYLFTLVLACGLAFSRLSNQHFMYWTAGLMASLTIVFKGSNFIFYFDGYLYQSNVLQSMLLGTFLGLGICLSIAILLYLATQWLRQRFGLWATWSLLLVYVTGQLVNALPLLVQIDLIDASETAWNSQSLIKNEFEVGHLFNVLFGYQATPSIGQVIVYIFALSIPFITFYWLKLNSATQLGNKQ